jgi:hypothetical protein
LTRQPGVNCEPVGTRGTALDMLIERRNAPAPPDPARLGERIEQP